MAPVPDLTTDQLTLALAIVGGVALLSLLLTILALFRLRRVRKSYAVLRADGEDRDIIATVGQSVTRVKEMDRRVDDVISSQEDAAALGRLALQRFSIVRYDAFEDMGGQLSFSAALLDDHGDGIVITSINGRTETRTYAKPVKGLDSEHNLSDEERDAIATAAAGEGRGEPAPAKTR